MSIPNIKILIVLVLLLFPISTHTANEGSRQSEQDGTIVAHVTWGDDNNTPADDVYIEAHGFVHKYHVEKSYVLTSSKAGLYEVSLPPGIYDVFVSEGASEPRCKRLEVLAGLPSNWTLKLKNDEVYTAR